MLLDHHTLSGKELGYFINYRFWDPASDSREQAQETERLTGFQGDAKAH